jgi:hypothetical protein
LVKNLIEKLSSSLWVKLEELLQNNSELFSAQSFEKLCEIVCQIFSNIVALHHVDCESHEIHILDLWVCLKNFLCNIKCALFDRKVDFKRLEDEICHHEHHLQISNIHVSKVGSVSDVFEELLEVIDCSLVDFVLLD